MTQGWSTNLRDSPESSPSPSPKIQPKRIDRILSSQDRLILDAEEEAAEFGVDSRDAIDIGEVAEAKIHFVETPFTIAKRNGIVQKRKRQREECESLEDEGRDGIQKSRQFHSATSHPVVPAPPPPFNPIKAALIRQGEVAIHSVPRIDSRSTPIKKIKTSPFTPTISSQLDSTKRRPHSESVSSLKPIPQFHRDFGSPVIDSGTQCSASAAAYQTNDFNNAWQVYEDSSPVGSASVDSTLFSKKSARSTPSSSRSSGPISREIPVIIIEDSPSPPAGPVRQRLIPSSPTAVRSKPALASTASGSISSRSAKNTAHTTRSFDKPRARAIGHPESAVDVASVASPSSNWSTLKPPSQLVPKLSSFAYSPPNKPFPSQNRHRDQPTTSSGLSTSSSSIAASSTITLSNNRRMTLFTPTESLAAFKDRLAESSTAPNIPARRANDETRNGDDRLRVVLPSVSKNLSHSTAYKRI